MTCAPRVAVAMAVYDDERYLPLALEALATQTFRDFRLTVYDDGSSDASAEIAERYRERLRAEVVRGAHLGRHFAKQAAWRAAAPAPYLLALDSDVTLPPDALARMVALLDGDPTVAAVSARVRAEPTRPLGASQAFLDDLFAHHNAGPGGEARWIVGGCVLLRRSAMAGIEVSSELPEDSHLAEELRRSRHKLLAPAGLVATHHGVPTTLLGVLRRFEREGVRVRALLRAHPSSRQASSMARLAPLPLAAVALLAAATGARWLLGGALAMLGGYVAAFLVASRAVASPIRGRVGAALLFTFGNIGFGVGYGREWVRGSRGPMREPRRVG